jgi:type IV secretory pathway ATPase VirB11/archaellum biosynthesis ATPase
MLPPAVPAGTVSLCIRRRALSFTPTLPWLAETGYFDLLDPAVDWVRYFADEVIGKRKTVILSGGIGESKTTAAEALLRAIPLTQRLVTVEGSPEWLDLPHVNWQPLYFDEADPESATKRVQDAMQSRPDWLCFQEVRGSEAWSLLRALKIGAPGITTVHAPTARRALDSLESMIRQSDAGRGMEADEIRAQLRQYIGVIAHCTRFLPTRPDERTRYRMTEMVEIGQTEAEDRVVSSCR